MRAFENLDRAIHDRDPNILGLKSNPIFDRFAGRTSAFLRCCEKCSLPEKRI